MVQSTTRAIYFLKKDTYGKVFSEFHPILANAKVRIARHGLEKAAAKWAFSDLPAAWRHACVLRVACGVFAGPPGHVLESGELLLMARESEKVGFAQGSGIGCVLGLAWRDACHFGVPLAREKRALDPAFRYRRFGGSARPG